VEVGCSVQISGCCTLQSSFINIRCSEQAPGSQACCDDGVEWPGERAIKIVLP